MRHSKVKDKRKVDEKEKNLKKQTPLQLIGFISGFRSEIICYNC